MATSTPFAYNTGAPIAGTQQVGSLAVGIPTSGFTNSPQFWNGPDEELGYVIAVPVSADTQSTPILNPGPINQMVWGTTYKATDISLSNLDMTATQNFSYSQSVLSDTFIQPGQKVMFTIYFNSTQPSVGVGGRVIGIGTPSMNYQGPFDGYPGNDVHSIGFSDDGKYYFAGALQATGLPTWTSNDIIDIAVDTVNALIWIRVNGGNWNNNPSDNPATATGSIGMGGLNSQFTFPAVDPYIYGSMIIFSSAPYGVPSGFYSLGTNKTASVGFYRTDNFTDNSFIQLTNSVFSQNFSSATDASVWLVSNGYWTSYPSPVLYLDAGNPASYSGTGTIWTDIISGRTFNLINGPGYDSGNGGKFQFVAANSQYAQCNSSLPNLSNWSVGVWHYYTGNNVGQSPCIVTEVYPGTTYQLNYALGTLNDDTPLFKTGFFNAGWNETTTAFVLTANTWYYIVGTYDGSSVNLYVNNNLIATTSTSTPAYSSNGGIRLMSRWDNAEYWDGYLSTVGIYDRALTQSQISVIWNAQKSRFGL